MQGNYDELKIFLQNRLIASRFDQKLREGERIHRFLKRNSHEKSGSLDPVRVD